jgi:glycosyltransferase involved in cell wall biosynthesis
MADRTDHLLVIGMPVYNGAHWLEESIESILSQSFTDFQLFIADNASTDETETICRHYARKDSRVRYHRHRSNRGVFRNFNDVFELTSSKYFKWASCSDHCKPTLFERCLEILEARDDVVLAYAQTVLFSSISGDERLFYQNLTLEEESPSDRVRMVFDWMEGLNNAFNGVFRRSILDRVMPLKAGRGFDVNLMEEMSLHGKFVEVYQPLFYRRYETPTTGELLSQEEKVLFFGANKTEFGYLQRANRQLDRFAMPFRTPIPFSEKLRVELELVSRLMSLTPTVMRKLAAQVKRLVP